MSAPSSSSGISASGIIDAVIQQVGTDASRAQCLSLLNEAYRDQVARARWFRTESSIGTTTAGTASYTLPSNLIELYGLKVAGVPWDAIGEDAMWKVNAGTAWVYVGPGGVFSQDYDSSGNPQITLYPAPTTDGDDITIRGSWVPADLTDSTASYPITPADTHSSLIDGTAALVLVRIDERPDLADPFTQRFSNVTEVLRRRKNGLAWGSRPAQIQVQGYHW